MAWGKKTQAPPSATKQLLPLIIVLVFLGAMAWVGYQIYLSMQKIQAQARRQMGDHVAFTKDGLRVQVKNIGNESYVDQTQSWVVKAWNLGSTAKTHDKGAHRKRHGKSRHGDSSPE